MYSLYKTSIIVIQVFSTTKKRINITTVIAIKEDFCEWGICLSTNNK